MHQVFSHGIQQRVSILIKSNFISSITSSSAEEAAFPPLLVSLYDTFFGSRHQVKSPNIALHISILNASKTTSPQRRLQLKSAYAR